MIAEDINVKTGTKHVAPIPIGDSFSVTSSLEGAKVVITNNSLIASNWLRRNEGPIVGDTEFISNGSINFTCL